MVVYQSTSEEVYKNPEGMKLSEWRLNEKISLLCHSMT